MEAGASVERLAESSGMPDDHVLRLCEYFRGKGLLDVSLDPSEELSPRVSVVVPVRDRAADLADCLTALSALDYPRERVEVIVVDDASTDETAAVARSFPCKVIVNERARGAAHARNRGARRSSGEILAFIDSDCVADPGWLRELVPYFAWDRVAAVGGMVQACFTSSRLDRYEAAASSLSMGRRLQISLDDVDTLYAPACNLLVRRDAYLSAGGMREDLRFGEDVDLCWRLRARGECFVYAPHGAVRHKHRDRLPAMLKQRAQYGTSEAVLHTLHPARRKRLPLSPLPTLTFVALTASLLAREPWLVPLVAVPWAADVTRRLLHLQREGVVVSSRRVASSVLRGHLSLVYYLFFHLVRYYLIVLVAAAVALPAIWPLAAFAVLYTGVVDYAVQRPRLGLATFLGYRVLEHAAYQLGVASGCLRQRTLRPYRVSWRRATALSATRGRRTGKGLLSQAS